MPIMTANSSTKKQDVKNYVFAYPRSHFRTMNFEHSQGASLYYEEVKGWD